MAFAGVSECVQNLFRAAQSSGHLEYIYTLVRVDGLEFDTPDALLALETELQRNGRELSDQDLLVGYCSLAFSEEPLLLIANLLRCTQGGTYDVTPMRHLWVGQFPNIVKPSIAETASEVSKMAREEHSRNSHILSMMRIPETLSFTARQMSRCPAQISRLRLRAAARCWCRC